MSQDNNKREQPELDSENLMERDQSITLYDRLGGKDGVREVVDLFYRLVIGDSQLSPYFEKMDVNKIIEHQAIFISFATGGPDYYSGQSLTQAHEGMNIRREHFDLTIDLLRAALEQKGVQINDVEQILSLLRPLRSRIAVN